MPWCSAGLFPQVRDILRWFYTAKDLRVLPCELLCNLHGFQIQNVLPLSAFPHNTLRKKGSNDTQVVVVVVVVVAVAMGVVVEVIIIMGLPHAQILFGKNLCIKFLWDYIFVVQATHKV